MAGFKHKSEGDSGRSKKNRIVVMWNRRNGSVPKFQLAAGAGNKTKHMVNTTWGVLTPSPMMLTSQTRNLSKHGNSVGVMIVKHMTCDMGKPGKGVGG